MTNLYSCPLDNPHRYALYEVFFVNGVPDILLHWRGEDIRFGTPSFISNNSLFPSENPRGYYGPLGLTPKMAVANSLHERYEKIFKLQDEIKNLEAECKALREMFP